MISRYVSGVLLITLVSCGRVRDEPALAGGGDAPDTAAVAAPGAAPTVVFVGTSLTAGLGLDPAQAYPALLQAKIDSADLRYHVVNAGVSGETSAGALRRIDWVLRDRPAVLVIETGANDGLRALSPDSLEANLQAIIDHAEKLTPAPRIVLVGMEALPNFGPAYGKRFRQIYPRVAEKNHLPLVPFLLAGVAGIDSLNQPDGMHPTAAGQRMLAGTVWKTLEPVLRKGVSDKR
jgi:acyl-CoA thioesterase I